jgi:hypothetical protein
LRIEYACLFWAFLLFAGSALAGNEAPASPTGSRAVAQAGDRLQLVEDEEAGAFRFFIDGREIARLDEDGLKVRDSVEYGGSITDTGLEHFDATAAKVGQDAP